MRFAIPWVGAQQGLQVTSPGRQLSERGGYFLRGEALAGQVTFQGGRYFLVLGGEVKKKTYDLVALHVIFG